MMDIKLLSKTDFPNYVSSFCDLYRCCFNDPINESIVEKRYLDNPYDDLYMCVAIADGNVVSNYAVSPTRVEYQGTEYRSALSLNTMTHPDYLGQGLFVKLAQTLYAQLQKEGYRVVYGCPNYLSNRTFCHKLNWRDIYEQPTMELVLRQKIPFDKDSISVVECDQLKLPLSDRIRIAKSHEYLNFRYTCHPTNQYTAICSDKGSWAIFKQYQTMLNIVEFHPLNQVDIVNMIGFIADYAHEKGLDRLTIWSKINTEEHIALEKLGFRNRYPITYFGMLDLGLGDELGIDIEDYRNWDIQMGDDNVY